MRAKTWAPQVSRQLADAGHQRAAWNHDNHDGWTVGYRAGQAGDDVVVSCEGLYSRAQLDAEARHLADYGRTLTNLGYHVETVVRETADGDPGRSKLIVTKAGAGGRG
jgi:hypothetical protein